MTALPNWRLPHLSGHQLAARMLAALRVPALTRRLPLWRGVLTLCYHRIGDPERSPLDGDVFSASADAFDEQVAALSRHCDVILPDDVPEVLRAGRGRHVLLTFDDGYRDNHDLALPILRRHRARAAFFLTTGFLDNPRLSWWDEAAVLAAGDQARQRRLTGAVKGGQDPERLLDALAAEVGRLRPGPEAADGVWMTWDMARTLLAAGMAVGGHSVTHPVLAHLSLERQHEEVLGCALRLKEELGVDMRAFCYPVGLPESFDRRTKQVLAEAGCEVAFTFHGGCARASSRPDLLELPRAGVGPWRNADSVLAATVAPSLFARW